LSIISYKRPIPTAKLIYGVGLIVLGILSAFQKSYGIISFVIGFYFFKTEGIEINLDTKTYRETIHWFNFTLGKWKAFPQIDYVSVFKTTQTTRVWVSTASTNVTDTEIRVNLFHSNNQKIEAYITTEKKVAFKVAQQIATALNVDILDATERESKWL